MARRRARGWGADPGLDPLDERIRIADRADRAAAAAEDAAAGWRSTETARRRTLDDLAAAHDLPTAAGPLAARRESLRELDAALATHADASSVLVGRVRRWADDAGAWDEAIADLEQATAVAEDAHERAAAAHAAADALEETIGAPVREIERRIAAAEQQDSALKGREGELSRQIATLLADGGAAGQAASDAAVRLAEQEPVLAGAVAALGALVHTPGLLASGAGRDASAEPGVFDLAIGFLAGNPVPATVLALARRFAELTAPTRGGTETAVFTAWRDAASGPAGDVDPRVTEIGGALAVVGRDDAGEHPIGVLAVRLAAAVARDADLLTDRERRLFEEHI
ncbi:MAG: hypothetical protein ACRD0H_01330, partial [Actinomycetes bacterium]